MSALTFGDSSAEVFVSPAAVPVAWNGAVTPESSPIVMIDSAGRPRVPAGAKSARPAMFPPVLVSVPIRVGPANVAPPSTDVHRSFARVGETPRASMSSTRPSGVSSA